MASAATTASPLSSAEGERRAWSLAAGSRMGSRTAARSGLGGLWGGCGLCLPDPLRAQGAPLLRVLQDEAHVGRGLRLHVDLVREERLAQPDQREVGADRRLAEHAIAQHLGEGGGDASHL